MAIHKTTLIFLSALDIVSRSLLFEKVSTDETSSLSAGVLITRLSHSWLRISIITRIRTEVFPILFVIYFVFSFCVSFFFCFSVFFIFFVKMPVHKTAVRRISIETPMDKRPHRNPRKVPILLHFSNSLPLLECFKFLRIEPPSFRLRPFSRMSFCISVRILSEFSIVFALFFQLEGMFCWSVYDPFTVGSAFG